MSGMFAKAASAFQPSSHHNQEAQHQEEGESLTTILTTAEDRTALTLLIADCTDVMRQGITDVFDATHTGTLSDVVVDLGGENQDEAETVDVKPNDAEAKERERKELEQRQKELGAPKMLELKTAVLTHFDDWRASVIQRVGEVINAKETASPQSESKNRKAEPTRASPMKLPDFSNDDPRVRQTIDRLYPTVPNPLIEFSEDKKALILHSVLLLLLSLEHYQSYSRTLLVRLSSSLKLPVRLLAHDESKVAQGLLSAVEHMKADDETKKRAEDNQGTRKWKVGLATVAGAALIGVTGGLAAPLLAAGVGSVMGGLGLGATAAAGYLGTLAGSGVLVGGLFGAYGGRMTGKMMDQYAREVEDFAFIPVRDTHKPKKSEHEFTRLQVAIGISGWLDKNEDVVEPWKAIGPQRETFALRWELDALLNLGNSISTMVKSAAWGFAKSEIIKRTVFASLMAGLWPLGLLKVSRIVDNPFSVAHQRAIKAGDVLADAIINKAQGERPVTLVGYSLGAKVIYTCLQRLAERKAFGLIESVVFIGAPAPSSAADWRLIRSVVSGRVVNVFSSNDYILAFLYRSSSIQYGIAGLQAIKNVAGVENVDVSDSVNGHMTYRYRTGQILQEIGFEDVDSAEVAKEERQLEQQQVQESKEREEAEKKELQRGADPQNANVTNDAVEEMEKNVGQSKEHERPR